MLEPTSKKVNPVLARQPEEAKKDAAEEGEKGVAEKHPRVQVPAPWRRACPVAHLRQSLKVRLSTGGSSAKAHAKLTSGKARRGAL